MHVIYDGERDLWPRRFLFAIGFGVVLISIFGPAAIHPQEDAFRIVPVAFFGIGLFIVYYSIRWLLSLPVKIVILDNRAVSIRTRRGERIYNAEQFGKVKYHHKMSGGGDLFLVTEKETWHLLCNTNVSVEREEADEVGA